MPSRQEAARELLARRRARADFGAFAERALVPLGFRPAAHHRLLIGELQRLAETPGGRLIVMMPPGSAKSTYASVLFPAWALQRGLDVIAASHTASFAEEFSAMVRGVVREHGAALGYGLATESVQRWRATNGKRYVPVGVEGAISGVRADLVVIDDPVKSSDAADSEVRREKAWRWFTSDVRPRLRPGGRVALVMTRWHDDDLAGRLLMHQPGVWRTVLLPALAEDGDALGRAPGAPLWNDDEYGYGAELVAKRAELEAAGAARMWWALYQQTPRNPEGALFRIEKLSTLDARPAGGRLVRAWDLAATDGGGGRDPDWTAGVLVARYDDGRFAVLDVIRLRGGPEAVEAAIVNTAGQDGRAVAIGLPQDPGQAGKVQAQYLTRRLAGHVVKVSPETGDKATRAGPAAAQVNVGNVGMVRAAWNAAFVAELRDFPTGAKDDQVDAFSRAFGMLATGPNAARVTPLGA